MKISFVDIQNFRKLKCCRVEFAKEQTLLVGANNSGKTSATDALICFLDKGKKITSTDFTLCNWIALNEFAEFWMKQGATIAELPEWQPYCPSLDVWIDADVKEVQRVSHLIPTLKWNGEPLGVRLIYQPKDLDRLRENYVRERDAVVKVNKDKQLSLWPRDFKDYLKEKLHVEFEIKAYLLDPSKKDETQTLSNDSICFDADPFKGIFRVDTIEAQRGFSDPHSDLGKPASSLSSQLNEYYKRHLNPSDMPEAEDLDALEAVEKAQIEFDSRLDKAFEKTLGEIKELGYPGFTDPDIRLSSRLNPIDTLEHDAAVIFDVRKQNFGDNTFSLPEQYNGLGYKNLIHIIFQLITFRDRWLKVGKIGKKRSEEDTAIEPIHLVLVEEPEAHLHAQVQQVFVRKAYKVLREYGAVEANLTTQMVISTHSSYVAYEAGFESLRYFKRKPASKEQPTPQAEVVNLATVFPSEKKNETDVSSTSKFVSRYLKTTHCDLFFANGVILVEGAAERMLLPHFISNHHQDLRRSYISILEIGGAHAQRLRPLIELLGLPTLVITDTDACDSLGKKALPKRGASLESGSETLKSWFDFSNLTLDDLLDLPPERKVKSNVRVSFQYGIQTKLTPKARTTKEVIPYTFEDAVALTNFELFKKLSNSTGMVKKMHLATKMTTLNACCNAMYKALDGEKAKMALDLLFDVEPNELLVPEYISEGLVWLEGELETMSLEYTWAPENKASEIMEEMIDE
ncbi:MULTISPECIES: ATP-dependent nuclease [Vibrio]|uniref:ATP-dependent endonuclease n=1 Tax=Vibrio lentus TaxID=136468 RepID=A0A855IL80_9VIBR|nr:MULTISPECIES: AAA family ATPase [Vibrio]PMM07797.1 ATP-dependent endonuclease [Vibrio splendidus]PMM54436.1 ATP-dependent endonuclease [Vibrio lentus]PMN27183.1 ATP-dependent endonuclease [Vibrio splendidus]